MHTSGDYLDQPIEVEEIEDVGELQTPPQVVVETVLDNNRSTGANTKESPYKVYKTSVKDSDAKSKPGPVKYKELDFE